MKKIYHNDGPMIFAADGRFYIKGHKGNELLYIDSEGQEGSIFVTGNTGSSIDGKGGEVGPGPGPVIPIAPMTLRFAFSQDSTDPTTLGTVGTWTKVDNYPGYNNVWDWTYDSSNWESVFDGKLKPNFDPDVKILDAGDTSSVTNATYMFWECSSLTSVALFDTSNVTGMMEMFRGCSLTTVPLYNTHNATDLSGMFTDCSSLTSVPLFDTSNATYLASMFAYCSSLTSVPLFNIGKASSVSGMFRDCSNIESGMLDLYNSGKDHISSFGAGSCFTGAGVNTESGRAERAQIPQDWGGDA